MTEGAFLRAALANAGNRVAVAVERVLHEGVLLGLHCEDRGAGAVLDAGMTGEPDRWCYERRHVLFVAAEEITDFWVLRRGEESAAEVWRALAIGSLIAAAGDVRVSAEAIALLAERLEAQGSSGSCLAELRQLAAQAVDSANNLRDRAQAKVIE
jgi:hypothetical protein